MQDDAIWATRIHPGNQAEVFIWQNLQPGHQDSSLKTEISGTEPAHPLIWTHQKFYKGFRGKARSLKRSQPGQRVSFEEALWNQPLI